MSKKRVFILIGVVIVLALLILIVLYNVYKEPKKELLKHEVVDDLYSAVEIDSCNGTTIQGNVGDMNNESLLYLIFGELKKEKLLKDQISKKDYTSAAKEVLKDATIPEEFANYNYEGYSYTLSGNEITRTKTECKNKYVSKLYGYTQKSNEVILHMAVGYIKDGEVYNLKNEKIGKEDEKELNKILDKGTIQVYTYKLKGNDYYLDSVNSK